MDYSNIYGKSYNMTGGSDDRAAALRDEILDARDNLRITGTSYYISSENGDDLNDGKSPQTPFRSFDRIRWMDFEEGDAVLLERGSLFRLSEGFYLRSGVSYGAYGSGPKPMIYGSYMNYAKPDIWIKTDRENVWKIPYFPNTDAGIVVFNGGDETGEKFKTPGELQKNFDFSHYWEESAFYLYCDLGNPGEVFDDIEIGVRTILFNLDKGLRPDRNGKAACNVTIDNICFKYSGTFAIRGSADCRNIAITNCEIAWTGGSYHERRQNRFGNGIEFTAGCQNILVDRCFVYQIFDSAMTFQGGDDSTVYKNIKFTNNLMDYCGMCGIEWWNSSNFSKPDYGVIENIYCGGNITRFTGYGWVKGCVRGARAVQGPWGVRHYPNMKNFVFEDNIFDCALGGMYSWKFEKPNPEHIMRRNSYYQRATEKGIANWFGDKITASGQKEFEAAISVMEKDAKIIKWLE